MSSRGVRLALSSSLVVLAASVAAAACSASSSASHSRPASSPASPPARPPAGAAAGKVRVAPAAGTPRTTFRVSFRAPARTGPTGGIDRVITVSAAGPRGHRGCTNGTTRGVSAARPGQALRVALSPGSSSWCPGAYSGRAEELGRPVCKPGMACPQFVTLTPIGPFRFVVRRGG